jgi:hypothetical protein
VTDPLAKAKTIHAGKSNFSAKKEGKTCFSHLAEKPLARFFKF